MVYRAHLDMKRVQIEYGDWRCTTKELIFVDVLAILLSHNKRTT
jgi:hypothetical protein